VDQPGLWLVGQVQQAIKMIEILTGMLFGVILMVAYVLIWMTRKDPTVKPKCGDCSCEVKCDQPMTKTRSEIMRDAGFTRRKTWKSLPKDE
jgi:hypothetical protein